MSMSYPASIGLFGGSFDPVHKGHLAIAKAALEQMNLQTLYWVPAAQSPLKTERPRASSEERWSMLQLALKDQPNMDLLDWELKRPGPSYTLDTALKARALWPSAKLFWLIGEDQKFRLSTWYKIDELKKLLCFLIYQRNEVGLVKDHKSFDIQEAEYIKGPPMKLSSSQIRERICFDLPWEEDVPESVAAYIKNQGLYR